MPEERKRSLEIALKCDSVGSLEAVVSGITSIQDLAVGIKIIHSGIGSINKSDLLMANTGSRLIVGFNVDLLPKIQQLSKEQGIEIRLYDIIYRITEDVEKALKGMLTPEEKENVIGQAEVRAVFKIPKIGEIAGCRVIEGEIRRNAFVRVIREDEVLIDGEVSSLKHEKDDVREVRAGFECGIGVKDFEDFEEGDILECYVREIVEME